MCKAFKQLLQELGDFAGQREVVAENLQSNVVRELHLLAKELREERKVGSATIILQRYDNYKAGFCRVICFNYFNYLPLL